MISNDLREREKMKIVEGYVVLSEKFEEIFHPDLLLVDSFRKINERKIISSFVFTVPPPPPQFLLRSDIIRSISYVPIMHVSLIQSFTLSMSILNSYARAIIKIFSRRGEWVKSDGKFVEHAIHHGIHPTVVFGGNTGWGEGGERRKRGKS